MNLRYIENYIINILDNSEEFQKTKLNELVINIRDYVKRESESESSGMVLQVIQTYNTTFHKLVEEYTVLDIKEVPKKIHKIQEILAIICSMELYLVNVLGSNTAFKVEESTMYKHTTTLRDTKEFYRSAKFAWVESLKALRSEMALTEIKFRMRILKESKDLT